MKELLSDIITKYNKATEYLNKGKPERGIKLFREVIAKYPCKEAYTNIGNCYRLLGNDREMIKAYEMALKDDTIFLDKSSETDLHAMNNLGLAKFMYGDDVGAIELYSRAITAKPDFWEAIWNSSTAVLRQASGGAFDKFPLGWELYKARFLKSNPIKLKNTRKDLLYWDGYSEGTAIVILAEQGIGDNIMFGRFLPLLQKKFTRVYVQCDPSLRTIFEYINCIPVFDPSEVPEDCVAYPMCSLGASFSVLEANPEWLRGFGGKNEVSSSKPRMGIVFSGSSTHANNKYRSIPVGYFSRFRDTYNLFSLNPAADVPSWVGKLPIKTWEDTASFARGMDIIVTVDTSVVHLLGSMGIPVIMLQPFKETDFRWGSPLGDYGSTVWYNSVLIYNNPQNWEKVFDRLEKDLEIR